MTIDERFEQFHLDNPHVYRTLVELARKAAREGRPRLGMKHLWEIARWELWTPTIGDQFQLNNDFSSRYARLIMDQEPDLDGYFETRKLRSA